MFRSLIEELYLDNRCIGEKVRMSKIYDQLRKKFEDCMKKLSDGANEERKGWLSELEECYFGLELESELTHMREGIRIGFRLAMEIFGVQSEEERDSFILKDVE